MNTRSIPFSVRVFLCVSILATSLSAQEFRPLLITLDHNDDFVITGDGQVISGMQFMGPTNGVFETPAGTADPFTDPDTGELVTSAPAPFQVTLAGDSRKHVTLGLLGTTATIDGSYPLQFGLKDLSLLDDVRVQVGVGITPYDNPLNLICDDCLFPSVTRTANGGIEVMNINDPITLVTVFAQDGGIISTTELPANVSVVESLPNRLTLSNPDGFSAESLADLDFLGGISSTQAVFAKFTLANDTSFGPFLVAEAVPEPSTMFPMFFAVVMTAALRRRRRTQTG